MNRIAAIFTSVYNTLKKVCREVKNNYASSKDEEKALWAYFTQFLACLLGICIMTLLFIFWTDHHEQVVLIDVENHGSYYDNDSCKLSFRATTGESSKESINPYGVNGQADEFYCNISAKKRGNRYSIEDVFRAAKERNIEIIKDSIKQDSCEYIISINNFSGSTFFKNSFLKQKISNSGVHYINYENLYGFNNLFDHFLRSDSIRSFLFETYNKKLFFLNTKSLLLGNPGELVGTPYHSVTGSSISHAWFRQGDMSTLNYTLYFNLRRIDLDKVHFSFKTPTIVSNIFPEPDVLNLYEMEYTDSEKISQILRTGLSFEMEFVSGKSLQDFRMNVLIMIMSILITYALTIFFRVMILLIKSVHIGKDNLLFLVVYPVVILLIGIFVAKIVNLVYVPWMSKVHSYLIVGLLVMVYIEFYKNRKLTFRDNAIYYFWYFTVLLIYFYLFIFIRIILQIA